MHFPFPLGPLPTSAKAVN